MTDDFRTSLELLPPFSAIAGAKLPEVTLNALYVLAQARNRRRLRSYSGSGVATAQRESELEVGGKREERRIFRSFPGREKENGSLLETLAVVTACYERWRYGRYGTTRTVS